MLDDIELLAYKYHHPQIGVILLLYWEENNRINTCIYELEAMKIARSDRRMYLKKYKNNIIRGKEKTKTALKYYIRYGDDTVLISLSIKAMYRLKFCIN